MELEALLRWLHVIGASVLLGTGAGIAFFMAAAVRSRNAATIAAVARIVVFADVVFTATAVVAQPITGFLLVHMIGWSVWEGWVLASLALYVMTGLFWLPVVWIQMRLRDLATHAVNTGGSLPPAFDRLYRMWLATGFPAFLSVLAILWLMINKPHIALP